MLEKIKNLFINNKKKEVSKLLYCFLALVVGCFGAHKFYAGKIGLGLIYAFLLPLPISIGLSLVDMGIAVFRKKNDNKKILV